MRVWVLELNGLDDSEDMDADRACWPAFAAPAPMGRWPFVSPVEGLWVGFDERVPLWTWVRVAKGWRTMTEDMIIEKRTARDLNY